MAMVKSGMGCTDCDYCSRGSGMSNCALLNLAELWARGIQLNVNRLTSLGMRADVLLVLQDGTGFCLNECLGACPVLLVGVVDFSTFMTQVTPIGVAMEGRTWSLKGSGFSVEVHLCCCL